VDPVVGHLRRDRVVPVDDLRLGPDAGDLLELAVDLVLP
jgi:hypothetical protein